MSFYMPLWALHHLCIVTLATELPSTPARCHLPTNDGPNTLLYLLICVVLDQLDLGVRGGIVRGQKITYNQDHFVK